MLSYSWAKKTESFKRHCSGWKRNYVQVGIHQILEFFGKRSCNVLNATI